ncbi:UNVERIFIED_CONTAM: hypothetical protein Sangu_3000800 [Sesamum angustifolium]|uniref:Uncharacterized protein n=1 Tax=Sesamum angustifolium TaxID=2727405 RepID=A0AAW2KMW0_9LAMI
MLGMRDMSEKDKLFNFVAGLKSWAQIELRRQGDKDLPSTIAAADCLVDFEVANDPEQRNDDSGEDKAKFGKKFKNKEKAKKVVTETSDPRAVEKLRVGCFIYGNLEHRARDCPKGSILNAIIAEQTDNERGTELARVGTLQLGTLKVQCLGCAEAHHKGLMMVTCRINDKEVKTLVDMETTNNFVSDRVVLGLGLDVKPWDSQVKAMNFKAVPVSEIVNMALSVGSWSGQCGNKLTFLKGEYDGGTTTGKKSEMAKARPSNVNSSKEGAHSPQLAGFSCIGKMQEEMHKRWIKEQQIYGVELETFTCGDFLKYEKEYEVWHFDDVCDGKRALVQSTLEVNESKADASMRTSTSVSGGGL